MSEPREPTGSLAEEARRLADAFGRAGDPGAAQTRETQETPETQEAQSWAAADPAAHPSACTWCPVCRGVDSLRAVDPEAVERLAAAVTALASALGDISGHLRDQFAPGVGGAPAPNAGGSHPAYDIPVADEED